MNKLPYFRNGRFYNDENDSIKSRLWSAAKVFFLSMPNRLMSSDGKSAALNELKKWNLHSNSNQCVLELDDKISITWIGHSTFLIKIAELTILTDPIFFKISQFFPRYTDAAFKINNLPKIDFVLISHNHRDHLDIPSIKKIGQRDNPVFLVPFGDKRLLKRTGFSRVFEMKWWDNYETAYSKAKFTFLPAVHWAGRGPFDINKSIWGSWMIECNEFKIYFAGDSSTGTHFDLIEKQFKNIDVALVPIGPSQPRKIMACSHLNAEDAVDAFLQLNARHFVPMHWGTFKSGFESVVDPIKCLDSAWKTKSDSLKDKTLNVLRFGQTQIFEKKC